MRRRENRHNKKAASVSDALWQDVLTSPEGYDSEAAKRLCRAYLASVFPWRFEMPGAIVAVDPRDRRALVAVPNLRQVRNPI